MSEGFPKLRKNINKIITTIPKRQQFFLVGTVIIAGLAFLTSPASPLVAKNPDQIFAKGVESCNASPKEERFSCYRAEIEARFKGEIPSENAVKKNLSFKSGDYSYAVFGTNCHTFYHAYGDYLATHLEKETWQDALSSCSEDCTSGCYMGLIKRLSLKTNFESEVLKDLFDQCPETSINQCAHEVGHVLHDKYVSSILGPLDEITFKKYGLKVSEDYKYVTYTEPNLDAPFEECRKIVTQATVLPQCYTGIGHNLFLVSEFNHNNFQAEFDKCNAITPANRDSCLGFLIFRIGINNSAPHLLAGRTEEGVKVCDDTISQLSRSDLKFHCYLGIGGGIGLFIDSDYDLTSDISAETEIRLLEKASLCDRVPPDSIDNCYKGLLGTPFKNIYKNFKYKYPKIDELLGPVNANQFQVVG